VENRDVERVEKWRVEMWREERCEESKDVKGGAESRDVKRVEM
jgi:hypothetical protein